MLSIENCKRLLGSEVARLSEDELLSIRDQMYSLAGLVIDRFVRRSDSQPLAIDDHLSGILEEQQREVLEERAAVLEFEGNLKREVAERLAVEQAIEDWSN